MKRYKQFNRLIVNDFTADVWQHPLHNHNHYEIIFIASGAGIHHLNKRLMPYKAGHLYLLGPEDEHEFIIEKNTRFIYFKFTKLYFDTFPSDHAARWIRDLDELLNRPERKKGDLLKMEPDRITIATLFELIIKEYQRNEVLSKKLVFEWFKSILMILRRNWNCCGTPHDRSARSVLTEELLEYIEMHIYDPKMLRQKAIAEHFHYSPNYIGTLFKDKVGTSLKSYIQQYRYNLLEQRLAQGNGSTKQLALEFGFTDESHLHRFVKGFSGKSFMELKTFASRS
ncbi:helix-turn-helix domain-containing protein [Sinomicrobium oceani]|uniref:helix-turn-helix domain-containing protein n=1 Tax=Sinomicrobium oceani TaxID=1150368 RepID=UPI00227CE0D2|nr:AraC family transcriptional regulator [Sinomicrobium oceani]